MIHGARCLSAWAIACWHVYAVLKACRLSNVLVQRSREQEREKLADIVTDHVIIDENSWSTLPSPNRMTGSYKEK